MTLPWTIDGRLKRILATTLLASTLVGCHQDTETVSLAPEPGPAKAKATAAFKEFSSQLKSELQSAMKKGGPVHAVEVCHVKAPQIADEVSKKHGFEMGRSSHRLRNPENAPQETVAKYLERYGKKPYQEVSEDIVAVGDDWIVISPIPATPLCLTCHGSPESFSSELKAALGEHYPEDQATGFQAGDVRGVMWARIPQGSSAPTHRQPLDNSSRQIQTH